MSFESKQPQLPIRLLPQARDRIFLQRKTPYCSHLACYFGDDYVHLIEGGQRQIKNLQVGDRVWGLTDNGQRLIEDEIMCIPHAGPSTISLLSSRI